MGSVTGFVQGHFSSTLSSGLAQLSHLKIPSNASPPGSAGASPSLDSMACVGSQVGSRSPSLGPASMGHPCRNMPGWDGEERGHHEQIWEMALDPLRGSVDASGAQHQWSSVGSPWWGGVGQGWHWIPHPADPAGKLCRLIRGRARQSSQGQGLPGGMCKDSPSPAPLGSPTAF